MAAYSAYFRLHLAEVSKWAGTPSDVHKLMGFIEVLKIVFKKLHSEKVLSDSSPKNWSYT